MDHELGESGVEPAVLERKLLGGRTLDCDARISSASRGDELLRRVDPGDTICATDALDQFRRQRTWATAHVEDALAGDDAGEICHLRRELDRVAAHESVVRLGGHIEAHGSNPFATFEV